MMRSYGGEATTEETKKVTRSIMIVRPPGYQNNGSSATPPASPAGSTPPVSPFSGKTIMPFGFFFSPEKAENKGTFVIYGVKCTAVIV